MCTLIIFLMQTIIRSINWNPWSLFSFCSPLKKCQLLVDSFKSYFLCIWTAPVDFLRIPLCLGDKYLDSLLHVLIYNQRQTFWTLSSLCSSLALEWFFCPDSDDIGVELFGNVQVFLKLINPFAPELPVGIHVLSTTCDVVRFNGQGQLCTLTCAEWRDLSNHTKMSTIQSRTPEKKAKKKKKPVCHWPDLTLRSL